MPLSVARRLERAFARAAHVRGPSDPALVEPGVRQARDILDARRQVLEAESCPRPVRRRIEGNFGRSARRGSARWLDMLFDSRTAALPALRGTTAVPRTLRYVGEGATVDLQVRSSPARGTVLHVAVSPACPGATVEVRTPHRATPQRAVLDGEGTVDLSLPRTTRKLSVTVRLVSAASVRIPTLHLP